MRATILILLLFFFQGCESNPTEFLEDPRKDSAIGEWSGEWLIYGDKLETGGGIILRPGAENQELNSEFRDPEAPEHNNVIRYSWNGKKVAGQFTWSAMNLSVTANAETYDITPSRDLSPGGYRRLTFWAKVALSDSTIVEFRGALPSFRVQQRKDSDWKQFVISFEPHMLKNVKDFLVISFQYIGNVKNGPGNGGEVFVDEIRYEK